MILCFKYVFLKIYIIICFSKGFLSLDECLHPIVHVPGQLYLSEPDPSLVWDVVNPRIRFWVLSRLKYIFTSPWIPLTWTLFSAAIFSNLSFCFEIFGNLTWMEALRPVPTFVGQVVKYPKWELKLNLATLSIAFYPFASL